MKIIFFGTPQEVVPVLENLTKHYEVIAVVTAPDKKVGRKQIITPPPTKVFAEQHNIHVLQPESLKSFLNDIAKLKPDLHVVAAYGKIIPQEILDLPEYGAINIHPSLLPAYRGPTPIQSALANGDTGSGITFIKMDAEMDHGPILHQIPVALEQTDTFDWLMKHMFSQAATLLPHVIDSYINGSMKPQSQDDAKATYTKILTKEDGHIDLDNPPDPKKLDCMIRAYFPWPNVWTVVQLNNKEVRIKFLPEKRIQMEGKQAVSLKDFLNGYPELRTKIKNLFGE
jgi:methionyl-tRNA formyltransferase